VIALSLALPSRVDQQRDLLVVPGGLLSWSILARKCAPLNSRGAELEAKPSPTVRARQSFCRDSFMVANDQELRNATDRCY